VRPGSPHSARPGRRPASDDGLKLTTYFGERSRANGRLMADELLDLHARHEILSSILLRGVQGFGAKHHLRSDRLLTLSEDLPLMCMAVDDRERIEALAAEVSTIRHEGLLTLEQARLYAEHGWSGDSASENRWPVIAAAGEQLAQRHQQLKLSVYLGRHERVNGSSAFVAVCKMLHDSGVAGASVLLGVDGTRHGERMRARFFARNANVPLIVMSVGDRLRIETAIDTIRSALNAPLFTIESVLVCKRDGRLLASPHEQSIAPEPRPGTRQKLTIVVSEATTHEKRPVYLELIRRLRAANAAGATALRGIWGFHGSHVPHGDRLLAVRRHVPVITELIDTPEHIATLFPIVDELTPEGGLVTSELIPARATPQVVPGL
jgi:PII-like signaling protein